MPGASTMSGTMTRYLTEHVTALGGYGSTNYGLHNNFNATAMANSHSSSAVTMSYTRIAVRFTSGVRSWTAAPARFSRYTDLLRGDMINHTPPTCAHKETRTVKTRIPILALTLGANIHSGSGKCGAGERRRAAALGPGQQGPHEFFRRGCRIARHAGPAVCGSGLRRRCHPWAGILGLGGHGSIHLHAARDPIIYVDGGYRFSIYPKIVGGGWKKWGEPPFFQPPPEF